MQPKLPPTQFNLILIRTWVNQVELLEIGTLVWVIVILRQFYSSCVQKVALIQLMSEEVSYQTRFRPNRVAADMEETEDLIFW